MKIIATPKVLTECCEKAQQPPSLTISAKGMLDSLLKTASPTLLNTLVESVTAKCVHCGAEQPYSQLDICK
jgi:hypothetical protein